MSGTFVVFVLLPTCEVRLSNEARDDLRELITRDDLDNTLFLDFWTYLRPKHYIVFSPILLVFRI